jgi:glycosyltransferase involved in cell wall biosynthesis
MPKVTIAIPTFNRVVFLQQALDSALAQTYPNIEVIVSNNASTDGTEKLLSTYSDERLKVMHQVSNIGMMGNWDACLASASGEFFLLLSDDDVLEKNAIFELATGFCDKQLINTDISASCLIDDQIGMVWCSSRIINEHNEVLRYSSRAPEEEDTFSMINGFFRGERETFPCSVLLRTSDIRQCGGYAASQLTLIADAYIWMACCLRRSKICFIESCLTNYRVHTDSGTSNATIDEWLHNNSELARFCTSFYQSIGEQSKANLIIKQIDVFNRRVTESLIKSQIRKNQLNWFRAIVRYLDLCGKYNISHCCFGALKEVVRMVAISDWFGVVRNKIKK